MGSLAILINAFSRFATMRTLVSSFYMLAHYLPICLFLPFTEVFLPLTFFSFSFFLCLSFYPSAFSSLSSILCLFLSDFLFIRPCIYLSVLFRPCVVCVCIRATSGIE